MANTMFKKRFEYFVSYTFTDRLHRGFGSSQMVMHKDCGLEEATSDLQKALGVANIVILNYQLIGEAKAKETKKESMDSKVGESRANQDVAEETTGNSQ